MRKFKPGDIVSHFKRWTIEEPNNMYLYEIIGIAEHTETKEQVMVYRALYGSCGIFVRPLDMFMSEVDKQKYPDTVQTYRFELFLG